MTTKNKFYRNKLSILLTALVLNACADFIEIDTPRTELVTQAVFAGDASATAAIRGIYSLMMTNTSFTRGAMEEFTGIAGDEFINYARRADQQQFYQNSLTPKNGDVFGTFWREAYKYISNANVILEGVANSTGMSAEGKNQIAGEAKFIRAFCHFYLANLFGDIPYITTSDYNLNAIATRMPYQQVLAEIEVDLLEAKAQLQEGFTKSNDERIQPNRTTATALLARLYLYQQNWQQAETMSAQVIENTSYSLLTDLNKVFLANSQETIWQLKPAIPGTNSPQGQLFILTNAPNGFSRRISITPELSSTFEANDTRKIKWIKTFTNANASWDYVFKYKVGNTSTLTEYAMIFRLAEQYLIRAEARAQLDKITEAKADLNIIRTRAGLPNTPANNKAELLTAIMHERQVEFFGEFGHRWLDLKRTALADQVLSPLKPQWQATDVLFPIPESEILLNPNLTQNPGY